MIPAFSKSHLRFAVLYLEQKEIVTTKIKSLSPFLEHISRCIAGQRPTCFR